MAEIGPSNTGQQQQQQGQGDSGMIDKVNDMLTNFDKLLRNPAIQKKINETQDQGGGRQVMGKQGRGGHPQHPPRQTQPRQPQPRQPQPQTSNQDQDQEQIASLVDYFSKKVVSEEGRETLVEEIEGLTEYLDPEASLEQIMEELQSEEFVKQIEQLKEQGVLG